MENQSNHYRKDIAQLNNLNQKEMKARIDLEMINQEFDKNWKQTDYELNNTLNQLNNVKLLNEKLNENIGKLKADNEIFKDHIIIIATNFQHFTYLKIK